MSQQSKNINQSKSILNLVIGLAVVFLIYVASVGPVMCISIKYNLVFLDRIERVIYKPLGLIAEENIAIKVALNDYVEWWMKVGGVTTWTRDP